MARVEFPSLSVRADGSLPSLPYKQVKEVILGSSYNLSIAFVPSRQAQTLNHHYRGKSYVPNTLSFPLDKKNGEIVICRSAARKECTSFNMSYHNYLGFLLIHSMLHLKGYEHGSTMEKVEQKYLKKFFHTIH